MAHFHDVYISNIKAARAMNAFVADAFPELRLNRFDLSHFQIKAETEGHIDHTADRTLSDFDLRIIDDNVVALPYSARATGIASREILVTPNGPSIRIYRTGQN